MDLLGFDTKTVIAKTDVSLRQLNHWDRLGIASPSIQPAQGSGSRRRYSAEEVFLLLLARTLRDAQGNVYVFPKLYLGTGAEIRVHTGRGENTPLHLYWNRDTAVWQEAGDTAVVADERGVIYASKPLE